MRDQDHRHPELPLEVGQQLQDLRLDRHVERRRGLVGDEDLGFACQRHGDHHALLHATAHLVWVVPRADLGFRNADAPQHPDGSCRRVASGDHAMCPQGLGDLRPDSEHRVETRRGFLEDHRDLRAAYAAHLLGGELEEIHPVVLHHALLRDVPRRRLDQPQQREGRHGLAAARFTHDTQRLSREEIERHVIHGARHGLAGLKARAQATHLEEWLHRVVGSRASRRPSPRRLNPTTVTTMAIPGKVATHGATASAC